MSQREKNVILLQLSEKYLISPKASRHSSARQSNKSYCQHTNPALIFRTSQLQQKQHYSHQLLCCAQVAKESAVTTNILVLVVTWRRSMVESQLFGSFACFSQSQGSTTHTREEYLHGQILKIGKRNCFTIHFYLPAIGPRMICRNTEHSQLQLKTTGTMCENMKYHLVLTQFSKQFIKVQFTKKNKFAPNAWKLLILRRLFLNNDLPTYLCALVVAVDMEIHCQ